MALVSVISERLPFTAMRWVDEYGGDKGMRTDFGFSVKVRVRVKGERQENL